MSFFSGKLKKLTAAALLLPFFAGASFAAPSFTAAPPAAAFASAADTIKGSAADEIIVRRAMRLAFLGQDEGGASWTPRFTFYGCNSGRRYFKDKPETSLPYSRSSLFNGTAFAGKQQYIGWVDPDTGMTASYVYSVANFLRMANTPGTDFDLAAQLASENEANWGALLGSDCSAFLSYAWQIPHMTTYTLTTDAVDWNLCREITALRGREAHYTTDDLLCLLPGDAIICCNKSGVDEHGNPMYRGHCILITAIRLDSSGRPVGVDTIEEISPRAIAKSRTAEEFLEYANKLHSSGAYYKFYRLVSKCHLKLELEIAYDVNGGDPLPVESRVAFVCAMDASGAKGTYDPLLTLTASRSGFELAGWSLTPGGEPIAPGTTIDRLTDHTLYAVWRSK